MTDFRTVTEEFSVSPQISLSDLAEAKDQGFRLIVNNRPDGEAPDQPTSAAVEAAAHALGLAYLYAPVVGRPDAEQIRAVAAAIDAHAGKALAFCRSGTRSIMTWALGRQADGADRSVLVEAGAKAGYDLGGVLTP